MRQQKGQALVEFAFILPILLFLLLGGIDLVAAFNAHNEIEYLAEDGARCAIIKPPGVCDVSAYVVPEAQKFGLPPVTTTTAISNGSPKTVTVTVTMQYRSLTGFISALNTQMTGTAQALGP